MTSHPQAPSGVSGEATPHRHAVVLGMHRSGTSLTARLLRDLGWYLGGPDELLGPRKDNPDGFFERIDIQLFNDRVLNQLDATWDAPPGMEEVRVLDDEGIDAALDSVLKGLEIAAGKQPFAVKDPRLCVLWPLWERHLPRSTTLVLTFRHPVEVAMSLLHRDGMPLYRGIALWDEHVRRSLDAAEDRAAVVLRYGNLVTEPEASVHRLAEALGTTVPAGWAHPVRSDLYRSRGDLHEALLTPRQHDLWSWIEELPAAVNRILPSDVPERDRDSFTDMLRESRNVLRFRSEVGALRQSLAEARGELDERAGHQSTMEKLLRERHDELQGFRSLHQAEIAAAEKALQVARDERDELARVDRAAQVEVGVLRDQLKHHEKLRARQEEQGARDAVSLVQLSSERDSLAQLVESLRQRRLEQSQRNEAMRQASLETEERLGRELAMVGQLRDELTHALAEQRELVQVGRAREQVLAFERHHLMRALTVVEAQRRAHEAEVLTMRGSRVWRWWRALTAPVGWMSATRSVAR